MTRRLLVALLLILPVTVSAEGRDGRTRVERAYDALYATEQITPGSINSLNILTGPLTVAASSALFQNGTTATLWSVCNTYTSTVSYECFSVDWQTQANVAIVGTRTAATGTGRRLFLSSQGSSAGGVYAGVSIFRAGTPDIRIGMYSSDGATAQSTASTEIVRLGEYISTATSGTVTSVTVQPTYNQSSGTAANTDLLINRTETAVGSGAQKFLAGQTGGTERFYITAGGATGRGTQMGFTQAVAPTCSTNCGTSPSVAGSDTAMRVTMGGSGVPASGWVVTFNGTWAASPICDVTMAKTGMAAGKAALTVVTTTTTITVVTNGTAPATSDVYSINCWGVP